jgi:hypothetical protein
MTLSLTVDTFYKGKYPARKSFTPKKNMYKLQDSARMTFRKIIVLLGVMIALGTLFPSCYYGKEQTLYPFVKCDTTNVTYSQTIVPVLNSNCVVCHYAGNPNSPFPLTTWDEVQVVVTDGKLIPSLDHTGPYPMPKGGSMLDDCTIQKFKIWVNHGAPNN